jgi:hypothetical protein
MGKRGAGITSVAWYRPVEEHGRVQTRKEGSDKSDKSGVRHSSSDVSRDDWLDRSGVGGEKVRDG